MNVLGTERTAHHKEREKEAKVSVIYKKNQCLWLWINNVEIQNSYASINYRRTYLRNPKPRVTIERWPLTSLSSWGQPWLPKQFYRLPHVMSCKVEHIEFLVTSNRENGKTPECSKYQGLILLFYIECRLISISNCIFKKV